MKSLKLLYLLETGDLFNNIILDDETSIAALKGKLKSFEHELKHLNQLPKKALSFASRNGLDPYHTNARIAAIEQHIKNVKQQILFANNKETTQLFKKHADDNRDETAPIPNGPMIKLGPHITPATSNFIHDKKYSDTFTGRPWDYKEWTSNQLSQYSALSKVLEDRGLPGFNKLYAGKLRGKYTNMIVANKGNTFVWRVYDSGPGSGQNWVYIDGEVNKTSSVLGTPAKKHRFSGI
jgi:hypothetical protein